MTVYRFSEPDDFLPTKEVVEVDCIDSPRLQTRVLGQASRRVPAVHLTNVAADAAWAIQVVGWSERLRVPVGGTLVVRDLPFQVTIDPDGVVVVHPDRAMSQHRLLGDPLAHAWARGLLAERIIVDFAAVDQVNSVLVAWLLQLAQSAKPAVMSIIHALPQIRTQFKQLRLDQMMSIA